MTMQRTIKNPVQIEGIGLHSGKKAVVKFRPASEDKGIRFIRTDLPDYPQVPAHINNVIDLSKSPRRTSLGNGAAAVETVEHLMAALSGLGIDNIEIYVHGEELPGLDGSATPFVNKLREAGIVEQSEPKRFFQIREPIWIEEDDASLIALPSREFEISYTLSYESSSLGVQYLRFIVDEEIFAKEIAPSRTFCLEGETDELLKQGLGKGANYDNTLVMGKQGIIKNKLRFDAEFARHKMLDLIGDLYLLGVPLKAHLIGIKSGHPLNLKLLKKIYNQLERWQRGGVESTASFESGSQLDTPEIMRVLPHRYPFLFVDKVTELEEDKKAVGIKNVTINDYFFKGHFPGRPVMPGVLIIEAMAQLAGILMLSKKENLGKLAYFAGIDKVRFRKAVVPGDQLRLEVEVIKLRSKTGQVHTRALVEGKVVAEANLMFSLVEA